MTAGSARQIDLKEEMIMTHKVQLEGPMLWTIADFGVFYTSHRSELVAHAMRIVRDSSKAEEVTQEALLKFMLAAPELASEEHALSYLHRTIENLCIDLFRAENRRPNLVLLDDATSEVEAAWQADGDHSAAISAAEDAAIVRQALALLSPAERTALVMWEMEGRSTQEIASTLGIKESAVRHTVSRARASLRKVLSTLVVDEKRGLTALDLLSTSYKKAADLAHKSGKAAMSLVLVIAAVFGFHSMNGSSSVKSSVNLQPSISGVEVVPSAPVSPAQPRAQEPTPVLHSVSHPVNTQDMINDLNFANAQLESAAVELQTLQMIQGNI